MGNRKRMFYQQTLEPLNFIGQKKLDVDVDADVAVRETTVGRINVTFYNGTNEMIGDRVVIAELDNRVYFKSDERNGYKLSRQYDTEMVRTSAAKGTPFAQVMRKYLGNYKLERDTERRLYYIDKDHELSGLSFIGKGVMV